ncbi:MAG TPA: DUF2490 domain-containing protein [Chitinophagaceae bacterium]|jgi:hypothetical protein|nr:DUF2490 domain-containing protein [Chitinophagaceae bacterium]
MAQQQPTFNGWLMYLNSTKLNKKFSLHFDAQLRSNAQVKHLQTLIVRPGINFAVKRNLTATLGYAFVENRRAVGRIAGLAPEHRIWEQLLFNHPLGFTRLTHRLRLEQRFISNVFLRDNSLDHQGNVFANRIRYFFRDVIPFSGKKQFNKGYFAGIQNEIFINIGDKSHVNRKYFDQNRAYISVGYRFNPKFDIDAGYLNQYITGRGNLFTNNHVLQLAAYHRL